MQKIIPCLWFDNQAEEAMMFYMSIFKNSKVISMTRYGEAGPRPKGMVMTTTFQLEGLEFMALNGGPEFTITPDISFFVDCKTKDEVDEVWKKLSEGGMVLMELDQYPFSEKFGWVQDKFGVSWQINLANTRRKITPFLMFVREVHGKAEEAMNLYTSVFKNSSIAKIERYRAGEEEPEGTVKHATFLLSGQEFMAIDSGREHPHTFTEAVSLFVNCATQGEVDELWEKLSEGGEKGQCGWLKDKYRVSWQIVPTVLGELLNDPDPAKSQRVMKAMLQMKKIDINTLKQAYEL
jgi:predicted 3-demethylubiquinone-9 3-methyltransferase (glyoxalase superfamily)